MRVPSNTNHIASPCRRPDSTLYCRSVKKNLFETSHPAHHPTIAILNTLVARSHWDRRMPVRTATIIASSVRMSVQICSRRERVQIPRFAAKEDAINPPTTNNTPPQIDNLSSLIAKSATIAVAEARAAPNTLTMNTAICVRKEGSLNRSFVRGHCWRLGIFCLTKPSHRPLIAHHGELTSNSTMCNRI